MTNVSQSIFPRASLSLALPFGAPVYLPRWVAVLLVVHAPLISEPFSVVGILLAFAGGGWIAVSVSLGPTAQGARRRART